MKELCIVEVSHVLKQADYVPKQTVSKAELIGDNKVDDWKVGDLVNHDIFGKGCCC